MSWVPVLLLPLLVGLVLPPRALGSTEPWRWGRELARVLLSGLGLAALSGVWLARFYMPGVTWTSTDFHEYCSSVAALAWGPFEEFTQQRSAAAAFPSAFFAQHFGVIDGMGMAALLSSACIGMGLYLWGRAIGGVGAGLSAVLMAGALSPLVVLSRTLSFYDEMGAWFTLGGAGAALALRWRNAPALAAGGVGVGLCLLADFRGLFWAVSFFGICAVAAIWPKDLGEGSALRRLGRWALRSATNLLALYIPLWGAWEAGRWAYRFDISLEEVMAPRQRLVERGFTDAALLEPFHADSAFLWGSSDPRGIPDTLRWVMRESSVIPRSSWDNEEVLKTVNAHVVPWLPVWSVALGLALLLTLRGSQRLARLGALLGTGVPFIMGLKGAVEMQRAQLHYQGTALPWMALIMGLAWWSLVELGTLPGVRALPEALGRRLPILQRAPGIVPSALASLLLLALILGGLPSPLAPNSTWRQPWQVPDAEIRGHLSQARGSIDPKMGRQMRTCLEALKAQEGLGFDADGTLFGGVYKK